MTRRRLSPDDRRAQLLDLGDRLFASAPYDEVHIERVAEQAGVSRGLLYHYFPTKRAFFAALMRRGTERMAAGTEAPSGLPPYEQLELGVQHYLDHVLEHRDSTRAFHRGLASADAEVQAVIEASMQLFVDRVLDVLEPDQEPAEVVRLAVRSWVTMMRAAGQELLEHPDVPVEQVRGLCVGAFVGLMSALPDAARPARVDEVIGPPVPSSPRVR